MLKFASGLQLAQDVSHAHDVVVVDWNDLEVDLVPGALVLGRKNTGCVVEDVEPKRVLYGRVPGWKIQRHLAIRRASPNVKSAQSKEINKCRLETEI